MPLLSILLFLPLAVALGIVLLPARFSPYYKWLATSALVVETALALQIWANYDTSVSGYQMVEQADWITLSLGSLGVVSIDYLLAVDGISLPMVLLSVFVLLVGAVSSFEIQQRHKAYFSLYLVLSSSIIGCFVALDFFLFYLFFEFMLLPMYFLIGLWGGPRREYASIKFFIYTLVGSLLILMVMIGLYLSVIDPAETAVRLQMAPNKAAVSSELYRIIQQYLAEIQIASQQVVHTFAFNYLGDTANYVPGSLLSAEANNLLFGLPARTIAFWLLFVGFAIKLPMVPLHTWLPDAHVEAPTPVSVVLAGILLKVGAYGMFRIGYDIFPDVAMEAAFWIAGLGVLSIIYGAFNALAQTDLKRLIAYSSVSHMGFVLLGLASLTAEGLNGALYQMFSHGILSAMLFLIAGVLYDRTHDRRIDSYQGLVNTMPQYSSMVGVAFFASLGMPGLAGFIGEFFSLMGGFNSMFFPYWIAALGAGGIVLGAAYFLWTFQRMFFGKYWSRHSDEHAGALLPDLSLREKILLVPLAVLAFVFGLFPNILFDVTSATVLDFLKQFQP
jgi:NADH-quinone oxidoreductase subunit M